MPAYFETGFFYKEPAWHQFGNIIGDDVAYDIDEAMKAGKVDWGVGLAPLAVSLPDDNDFDDCDYKDILGDFVSHNVVYRTTDKSILGVVGPNYVPLQNSAAFQWFKPFLDSKECRFESAGSLKGGRKVWVLATINRSDSEISKGDYVKKFLLLSNSHDGTTSIRVGFTPIRVVCANTLAYAHSSSNSQLLRVRHTQSASINLDNIRATIDTVNNQFEATAEQYRLLANRDISAKDLRKYVKLVLDAPEDDNDISTRMSNIMDKIFENFETGEDAKLAGKTYWGAYNAYNSWLNHERGNNLDSRYDSLWFGSSQTANNKALSVAIEMSA